MTDTKTMKLLYYGAVLFILIFILGPILWALIISLTPETMTRPREARTRPTARNPPAGIRITIAFRIPSSVGS